MNARGMVLRMVELRARRLSDPARRLQYLRRAMLDKPAPERRERAHSAWLPRLPIATASVGIVLAGAGLTPACRRALGFAPTGITFAAVPSNRPPVIPISWPPKPEAPAKPDVWLVEANSQFDLYSNGLRVENQFAVATQVRGYLAFPRRREEIGPGEWRFEPAGIVFHTTESHIVPFREDHKRTLRRAGEGLLEYVRRNRSYHFVIDRFGRIFRVVRESDYANHAGNSVWADTGWVYVNLNQSFFGIAFEAQSRRGDEGLPVNPAQVYAGRILTEMLLARYRIAPPNCVAHAQVSVSPAMSQAGYHTDWAANLPFRELGLPDNYNQPLPSMTVFGFSAGQLLAAAGEAPLGHALEKAQEQLQSESGELGLPVSRYRETLQKRYRDAIAALHARGVLGENN